MIAARLMRARAGASPAGLARGPAAARVLVRALALTLAACALTACRDPEAEKAALAARAAAIEDAANRDAAAFDDAVASENWPLAKAQADVLMDQYPDSAAAKRVRGEYAAVKQKAEAAREAARTAALWSYNNESVQGGLQTSASIYAKDPVDVDGTGATPVRLIFRDHPSWGRSSYLVLQVGDFDCYRGCKVQVTVDDQPPRALPARRPDTDEAIAMFIEDEKRLWRMTRDARLVTIEFPTKGMGKRSAAFEVSGLDRGRLPGWD